MATVTKEIKKKVYRTTNPIDANAKCPPQMRLIIDTINANGGKMTREDLVVALGRPTENGGLKTVQTPERILSFYRPKLIALQVVSEETIVETIEVEVPDKPAKSESPAPAPSEGEPTNGEPSEGESPAVENGKKLGKGKHKAA